MPPISAITNFAHDEPMDESGQQDTSTSLQVSTTSPENPPLRALHVKKSGCKGSRESSSRSSRSSSASSRPPTGVSVARAATHRGPGSVRGVGESHSASEAVGEHPSPQVHQHHLQQNAYDQRTMFVVPVLNVQQNLYDQRSINVEQRQIHVGINPQVMSQAG